MQKYILSGLFSFFVLLANAQDVIFKRNGDEIKAKVAKITDTEIEYKKWANPNGPAYTIKIGDVFMIKYENGEKDVFEDNAQTSEQNEKNQESSNSNSRTQRLIEKQPAPNNAELIRKYHPEIRFNTKLSKKATREFFPVLAVSDSSILSTDEIEIRIVPAVIYYLPSYYTIRHYIEIKNKTAQTIYIDKANTFRIYADSTYMAYYNQNQTSVSKGGSSGVGVGLGGIANVLGVGGVAGALAGSVAVSGSSQSMVTHTYNQQRIMAIPPHATANLSEFKQERVKWMKYELISDIERWSFDMPGQYGILKKGEVKTYNEDESPYKNKYHITYSTEEDFSTYSRISFGVYAKYLVGTSYCTTGDDEDLFISMMKGIIPDFWDNPYVLIGVWGTMSKP